MNDNIDLNQSGIYAITSPSGKRYVGSAVNIRRRWKAHRKMLRAGTHHCKAFQKAYVKYQGDFEWSVLVLCTKEELIREEQRQMDLVGVGALYNACLVAGSRLGCRATQQMRDKISALHKGKIISQQHRADISRALKGKALTPEHKAAISHALHGKALTESHKATMVGVKRKTNTSGYVGVVKASNGNKWSAQRRINGRSIHLGIYPTAELANQARQNFDRMLDYYSHS